MKNLFFFLVMLPLAGFSQLTDDFTDGNFTNNPTWTGETTEFKISTSKQLQLNATAPYTAPSDTAYLYTANGLINNTEWDFWAKLSLATSANNNGRVYLVSDQTNLEGALNGYFVQLGDFGDGKDSLSLYKQAGTGFTKIIAGTIVYTNNSVNSFRIKVTRDNAGNWSLFSDPAGGTNFQLEGAGYDNTFISTSWFGVFCKYTSSNSTKFYFDDFYIGPILIDTIAPVVNSVLVQSSTQLDVLFSENVSVLTAENVSNYTVNNGIGSPVTAVKDGSNGALVHLTFSSSFVPSTTYTIHIDNVQDVSNNTMLPVNRMFALYTPGAYDVLIDELMADPDPPVGLPNYEYAELFNRTPFSLDLKNWTLTVGSSVKLLPSVIIEPDSFIIICSQTAQSSLSTYGPTLGLSSFSLTNTGQTLTLADSSGHIIHTVSYTDSWYQDANKANGGWSLEMIDPSNPCGDASNWSASIDASGGTPGRKNSIHSVNPDNVPPQLSSVNVVSSNVLQLNFSESIDSVALLNTAAYSVDNGIGTPVSVALVGPSYTKVIITLASALAPNILYTCTVTDTIYDCAGNSSVATSSTFSLYEAKQFDVVINEIMADPDPPLGLPNYEYVELYNCTVYPISMKGWLFQMGSTIKTIPDATIDPHGYLLLTEAAGELSLSAYGATVVITSFSVSNTGETLSLYDSLHRVISTVSFTDAWYQDANKKDGGWSLEQVDPGNPCAGESNWRASYGFFGGTPGAVNSVNASNSDHVAPQLIRAGLVNNNSIQLFFSEPMDSTFMQNNLNYTIDNGVGNPATASPVSPDYLSVVLGFATAVQTGIVYKVTVLDTLKDCAGNVMPANCFAYFAIPQLPDPNDIVINEVLSNPKDNGVDYIELYNRSNKVIDLKDLVASSYDSTTASLTDVNTLSPEGYLVFPQNYVLLTTNAAMVKSQYYTSNPNNFAQQLSLPAMNNDDGCVVIALKNLSAIIDKFTYTASMYFPLLNSNEGVSLERINFDRPTADKTNWHSAAETVGFGTPAYKNSQYADDIATDDPIIVSPEIFSPDNDGNNDVLNIGYSFSTAGYVGTIVIYDANGRLIRNLVKSELLGTSGSFSWDGITNDNEKARIGIYIIYFEVFDLKGNTKHYKKTAVLASKL